MDTTLLLLNGPNLNLLGTREPEIYGTLTLQEIENLATETAAALGYKLVAFQSNHEGELVDKIHEYRSSAGIIINPGAFTHYSYAIYDAIAIGPAETVEVHISNLHAREEAWRTRSVISPNAAGTIAGFGSLGYVLAVHAAVELHRKRVG